jgi:hypothetical protein
VDVVFADDRLIDRIAQSPWGPAERTPSTGGAHRRDGHRPAYSDLATADPLTELFETWRDELAADPMPALPRLRPALVPQVADRPAKRRSTRPALAIAAAIAALLVGSATIGSKNADPNSALWGITQVVWPNRVQSVASVKTVKEQLKVARTALQAGRSRDAQMALIAATVELGKIDPVDGQDDMTRQVRELMVTASDQAAAATQAGKSTSSSSATSSADLSTLAGTTAPSTLAPAPLVTVTPTEPAAELAGGVGAPATVAAPIQSPALVLVPALVAPQTTVEPSAAVPTNVAPGPSSAVPVTESVVPPPASTDPPSSGETTSLPPPEPVQSSPEVAAPASVGQSAPEQSPPAPTSLTQTPEPDPTVDRGMSAVAGSVSSADVATNAAP